MATYHPPQTAMKTNASDSDSFDMYTDSEEESEYHRASVAVSTLPSDTNTVNPSSPPNAQYNINSTSPNTQYTNTFQSFPQNGQQQWAMMQQMQQQSISLMQIQQMQNIQNQNNYYQSPYMQMQQMQQQSVSLRQINTAHTHPPPPPSTPPPPDASEKKTLSKKRKTKSSKKRKFNKKKVRSPPPIPTEEVIFHPTQVQETEMNIGGLPRPPAYTYALSDDEEEVYKPKHQKSSRTKRENAVAELIGTEVTYLDQLEKLVKLYADKLGENEKILCAKDHNCIFPSSLRTIANLNRQLLSDFEQRQSECSDDKQLIISDIFIRFAPYFKMYQSYINNSTLQLQTVTKCLKNNKFYNFQQKQRKHFKNLSVTDLIILPVQRIPRYRLLMMEITKRTDPTHIDYDDLQKAVQLIAKINIENNEKLKDLDARMKVLNITNEMDKAPNLSSASRRFIYSNELYKIKVNGKIEKNIFYLFNDCIIYAIPSTFGKKCVFKMRLPIDAAFAVQKIKNTHKYKNVFAIYSSLESFLVTTKANMQSKLKWLTILTKIINNARNSHFFQPNSKMARIGRGSIMISQAQLQIPKQLKKELNKELSIINMPQTLNPKEINTRKRFNTKYQMELLTDKQHKMQVIPDRIKEQKHYGRVRRKNNAQNGMFSGYQIANDDKFEPDLNELSDDEKEFFMSKNMDNIQQINISQSVRALPGIESNGNRNKSKSRKSDVRASKPGTPPPPTTNRMSMTNANENGKRRRSSFDHGSAKQYFTKPKQKFIQTEYEIKESENEATPLPKQLKSTPVSPRISQKKKTRPPPPSVARSPKPIMGKLAQSNSSDIVENTDYAKVNIEGTKKVVSTNPKATTPKVTNVKVNKIALKKSKTFTAMNENKKWGNKSKGTSDALSVIKKNRFKAFEEMEENGQNKNDGLKTKVVRAKSAKKYTHKPVKVYEGDVTLWNTYLDQNNGNEPANEWSFHKWIKSNKDLPTISFKQARDMFKGCKGKGKIQI